MIELIFILIGLAFGSFGTNIYSYYVNKSSFDILHSKCGNCRGKLKLQNLIPVISFLLSKGRCRICGNNIPQAYLIIELLSGLTALLTYWKFGISTSTLLYFLLFYSLLLIAIIDAKAYIIPNSLVVIIFILVAVFYLLFPDDIIYKIITSVLLVTFLAVLNIIFRKTKGKDAIASVRKDLTWNIK